MTLAKSVQLWPAVVFIAVLAAFVIESELTQYVQTTLAYRHPYFLFYMVHSSFAIIFPLHLCYLVLSTKASAMAYCRGLRLALLNHLSSTNDSSFPFWGFTVLLFCLTIGVTLPALLWFAAVTLAPLSDVTAIWNTNAFFSYLIAVKVFGLSWHKRRLAAVVLATAGVLIVVYGGSKTSNPSATSSQHAIAPFVGDLLTLIASVGYALYQVMYKKYAVLPSDPEAISEGAAYQQLSEESEHLVPSDLEHIAYPPPFGLHPNLLTCAIGVVTFLFFWIPIPVLHYLGIEPFGLPENLTTLWAIAGIGLSGTVFNAGFMILLSVWGPIITSVGGLLTIVLVFITDALFGAGWQVVTVWSVLGCCTISAAFAILAYDTLSSS